MTRLLNSGLIFLFMIPIYRINGQVLKISKDQSSYNINELIEIYEDTTKTLELSDVLKLPFEKTKTIIPGGGGYSKSNFWIRVRIHKSDDDFRRWLLVSDNFFLDSITMYYRDKSDGYVSKTTGLSIKQSQREVQSTDLALSIPNSAFDDFIYLKVNSNDFANIPLRVSTAEVQSKYELKQFVVISVFSGVLLLFLVFTTIIFFKRKEPIFAFLSTYILASWVMGLEYEGIAVLYFWPESDFMHQWSSALVLDAILITMIPYVYNILDIKKIAPNLKWLFYAIYLFVFCKLIAIAFVDRLTMTMLNQIPTTVLLIFMILGLVAWRKGNKNGLIYSTGWILYLISMIPFYLMNRGELEPSLFTQNSPLIGTVVELLCLSIAAMRQVNETEAENKRQHQELLKTKEELYRIRQLVSDYKNQKLNNELLELLSKREIEVLEKLAEGLTNNAIAEELFVSVNTVKFHLRNIYEKLGVNSKKEMIEYVMASA